MIFAYLVEKRFRNVFIDDFVLLVMVGKESGRISYG
jgi:hypothetical protein